MNILKLFGDTNVSISDTLFNNKNVKYVSIFHNTCDCISKRPETTGSITFIKGDMEGQKKFVGKNIMEVISKMVEFIGTLK